MKIFFSAFSLIFLAIPAVSFAATERVEKAIAGYDQKVALIKAEFAKLPMNPQEIPWVSKKIDVMYEVDQYSRNLLRLPFAEKYSDQEAEEFSKILWERTAAVDRENTQDVKDLLKIYPWFKISVFGKFIDQRAWILVQHADFDPDFQKDILKILEKLYPAQETSPANYAYLFDRVASSWNDTSKRTLQRYGTQGMCTGPGTWEPLPVEDAPNLDQRRAEVGLEPEAEYIERFKDICTKDQRPH